MCNRPIVTSVIYPCYPVSYSSMCNRPIVASVIYPCCPVGYSSICNQPIVAGVLDPCQSVSYSSMCNRLIVASVIYPCSLVSYSSMCNWPLWLVLWRPTLAIHSAIATCRTALVAVSTPVSKTQRTEWNVKIRIPYFSPQLQTEKNVYVLMLRIRRSLHAVTIF